MPLIRFFRLLVLLIQSMSGIQVDAEINGLFNDMRLRSTHKFAFFKIEGKEKIVADVRGDPCIPQAKEEDEAQFKNEGATQQRATIYFV